MDTKPKRPLPATYSRVHLGLRLSAAVDDVVDVATHLEAADEVDEQGNTALHLAAQGDHKEVCIRVLYML